MVHVSGIGQLNHRVAGIRRLFVKGVECGDDVGVLLQVDPLADILVVFNFTGHKLLAKLLMVKNERLLTQDGLHDCLAVQDALVELQGGEVLQQVVLGWDYSTKLVMAVGRLMSGCGVEARVHY